MSDRPQYPSYPGDDETPPAKPAPQASPEYGQAPPPGYGQAPPPGYGQAPPLGYGQAPPSGYGQVPPPGYGQVPPPGYGQVPPPGYGYSYPPQPAPSSNGKAIASLVLGIVSIVFCYLGLLIGPAAIVLSVLAGREMNTQPPGAVGNGNGKGMATAGLVTGIVGTVIWGAIIALIVIGMIAE